MSREMKDSGIEWIGKIPKNWGTIRLKYIFDVIGGNGFSEQLQGEDSGDYPFCKVSDINGTGAYVDTAKNYVSKDVANQYRFSVIPQYSLIMAKIGAALLKNHRKINLLPCCIDNNSQALVLKKPFDIKYAYYLSKCIDMNWFNNGGTIPSVNNEKLMNCYIPMIELKNQHIIADLLDKKCNDIDSILSRTRSSIEEYKKLKQAVITQAVTKGIRGKRSMKNSGVEWIGSIPEDWQVFRVANLYQEASDRGNDELPILTVSINSGVSDRELSDEESERVFVRSEDRSKYKRVQPGDLVYNMMRAWQGAFGAVRVDGMVSPAYVVARPMEQLDSRYVEYLFRTPEAIEEMHRYSYGVADFRLRLYWPQFRNIRMCVPSYEEQVEIADYIDSKVQEILALIKKKEQYLVELENYKKSLIYEYVTGKKEVPIHERSR